MLWVCADTGHSVLLLISCLCLGYFVGPRNTRLCACLLYSHGCSSVGVCNSCIEIETGSLGNRFPMCHSNGVSTCKSVASSCGIDNLDLSCWYCTTVLRLCLLFRGLVEDTLVDALACNECLQLLRLTSPPRVIMTFCTPREMKTAATSSQDVGFSIPDRIAASVSLTIR